MSLREKMLEMLDSTCIEEVHGFSGDLLVSISLAAMTKANVYLWAERDLHTYVRLFKSWDLNVHRVVCALPKEFQKVDDVEIISPENLFDDKSPNKFLSIAA